MISKESTVYREESKVKPISLRFAGRLVHKMLSRLRHGHLILHDSGEMFSFGHGKSELVAHVYIHSHSAYRKILLNGSVGAGEAYIEKLWDTDDLTSLVRILVANMEVLDGMEKGFAWLLRPFMKIHHLLNRNDRRGAKKNILAHYDLGNEMYSTFLDSAMMYSSAIFPRQDSSLDEAAQYKLELICSKLKLQAGDHVLEIGTGWGGFAVYAAQNYGCRVTTTTISTAQYLEAEKRVAAAGLEDRITLLQKDYRDLQGNYDKLVSIEMIEAVGHAYLPEFFKKCGELLQDNGRMLLQAITIRDSKYMSYVHNVDFIQKHIFPGGCLPSNTRMQTLLTEKTDMVVRHLEDFGGDYARTLALWRERFNRATSILTELGYDERFRRLWNFYLCYCEGGFLERSISVVHLVADRPAARP
jgi:cyclopropane-fatty-acyl-phospholipid synthase